MTAHCVAPPITRADLERWEELFAGHQLRGTFLTLRAILEGWAGIPGTDDRDAMAVLFDTLTEPHRTPAFHLLWAANELALGRPVPMLG
jgi:hypothetical protein